MRQGGVSGAEQKETLLWEELTSGLHQAGTIGLPYNHHGYEDGAG